MTIQIFRHLGAMENLDEDDGHPDETVRCDCGLGESVAKLGGGNICVPCLAWHALDLAADEMIGGA